MREIVLFPSRLVRLLTLLVAFVLISGAGSEARAVNIPSFTAISTNGRNVCAIKADSTLWCWGEGHGRGWVFVPNPDDDGPSEVAASPLLIPELSDVEAVTVGETLTCALKHDHTVWCWGRNDVGQLGSFEGELSETAVQIEGLVSVKSVSAGGSHACALSESGTVQCWGSNKYGQLGDGTTIDRVAPVRVLTLAKVKSIDAGSNHTCAVKMNGRAWCWGKNLSGMLGDGTTANRSVPVKVLKVSAFRTIEASVDHTCGISVSGYAYCWGSNGSYDPLWYDVSGQLGIGIRGGMRKVPHKVLVLGRVLQVSLGHYHTCAINTLNQVYCWGWAIEPFKLQETLDRSRPKYVAGGEDFIAIARGGATGCGLKSDGTAWCWGVPTMGIDSGAEPKLVSGSTD